MITDFAGDLKLTDTADGGTVAEQGGLFVCDTSFSTAVYLSLFGGNENDAGVVESTAGWWGNYTGEGGKYEKMVN